jgi:hypothetical protein
MRIKNLFSISLRAIWRNKTRSILTMLGVIIGYAYINWKWFTATSGGSV